jgi:hypothetical protein
VTAPAAEAGSDSHGCLLAGAGASVLGPNTIRWPALRAATIVAHHPHQISRHHRVLRRCRCQIHMRQPRIGLRDRTDAAARFEHCPRRQRAISAAPSLPRSASTRVGPVPACDLAGTGPHASLPRGYLDAGRRANRSTPGDEPLVLHGQLERAANLMRAPLLERQRGSDAAEGRVVQRVQALDKL